MNTIKYWIMKRRMKRDEVMIKAMFYGTIASIINDPEMKETIELAKKLANELKAVPQEDLRKEFISKIAEFAHAQAVKERETEKTV